MEVVHLLIFVCCLGLTSASLAPQRERQQLYDFLFVAQHYKKDIAPSGEDGTIKVNLSISAVSVISLENDVLELSLWQHRIWVDSRLSWDPEDFAGISELKVSDEKIWLPEMVVAQSLVPQNPTHSTGVSVIIYSTGQVSYVPPLFLKTRCYFDENDLYGNNTVQCFMKFTPWAYTCQELDLITDETYYNESDLVSMLGYGDWKIKSIKADRNELKYICCPETYCDVTYTFTLQRVA